MKRNLIFLIVTNIFYPLAMAQSLPEKGTEQYFESIKSQQEKLINFLKAMPKGGDLHNHEIAYAENMLEYSYPDDLCINPSTFKVFENSNCQLESLLNNAIQDINFKNALIDAWSMRNFEETNESGHDHFFATFDKFSLIKTKHSGEILAETLERAGIQNEQYLELMVTPDGNESGKLGKELGYDPDFDIMRDKLLHTDFDKIIDKILNTLDQDEAKMRSILHCDTQTPNAGCHVKVRYLYQVLREQPPEMVFAQLLAGFETSIKDKRVVGINMVQPEDGTISMRDYQLHMEMVKYLHEKYPTVHISLHAGELTDALVPPNGLKFHIHNAINTAFAERIGHGVDIAEEDNAEVLFREMADQHIMVEINLTSNAFILNVEGANHPLLLYLQHNVPVALSTDDEGINRNNLTMEFERAVNTYHFSYSTLKTFVRNSIAYSFLPGKSIWKNNRYERLENACCKDVLGSHHPSSTCQAFLSANEKARMQWELEKQFVEFESRWG